MVVCHVVHLEYSGGSCVMFYTTSIVVVVCHVVHDKYSCLVSCCARLV